MHYLSYKFQFHSPIQIRSISYFQSRISELKLSLKSFIIYLIPPSKIIPTPSLKVIITIIPHPQFNPIKFLRNIRSLPKIPFPNLPRSKYSKIIIPFILKLFNNIPNKLSRYKIRFKLLLAFTLIIQIKPYSSKHILIRISLSQIKSFKIISIITRVHHHINRKPIIFSQIKIFLSKKLLRR